jgi:hypothetical protein
MAHEEGMKMTRCGNIEVWVHILGKEIGDSGAGFIFLLKGVVFIVTI